MTILSPSSSRVSNNSKHFTYHSQEHFITRDKPKVHIILSGSGPKKNQKFTLKTGIPKLSGTAVA
jgi:hypothetical protein